jgi:hypothetical protein
LFVVIQIYKEYPASFSVLHYLSQFIINYISIRNATEALFDATLVVSILIPGEAGLNVIAFPVSRDTMRLTLSAGMLVSVNGLPSHCFTKA